MSDRGVTQNDTFYANYDTVSIIKTTLTIIPYC